MKKCGFIGIIGKPNVGKSSFINMILNKKISITSRKPQTTRNKILGVKTNNKIQYIYIDTPGVRSMIIRKIDNHMNKLSFNIVSNVDVIIFMIELFEWSLIEDWIILNIKKYNIPILLVINKVDKLKHSYSIIDFYNTCKKKYNFKETFLISVKHKHNINNLENKLSYYLPFRDHLYYQDITTDKNNNFVIKEIIREKLIRDLGKEIPYDLLVYIDNIDYSSDNFVKIYANIVVNKLSQKKIIIGSEGKKIHNIGLLSRIEIEKLLNKKVYLSLWIKVKKKWFDNDNYLKTIIF